MSSSAVCPAAESQGYPLKRSLDVVIAGALLVLLSPIFVLISISIRLTSRGPAIYREQRLGRWERPFTILKFRTMRIDASTTGPAYTVVNDARITPIGKVLRKTSLDELPQLLNVLLGDMSLVGPRPYKGFELADWTTEQRQQRGRVRPGITGLSQSLGRSNLTAERILAFDLEYVQTCSLILDCMILARTVATVLLQRGVI